MSLGIRFFIAKTPFFANLDNRIIRKSDCLLLNVRGHYSYRILDAAGVSLILDSIKRLNIENFIEPENNVLTLHWRLGDLTELKLNSMIDSKTIQLLLEKFLLSSYDRLEIFSDSPELVREIFPQRIAIPYVIHKVNAFEVIYNCIQSKTFVGTNSKISVWIIIFRSLLFPNKNNAIPEGLSKTIIQNLISINPKANLYFY